MSGRSETRYGTSPGVSLSPTRRTILKAGASLAAGWLLRPAMAAAAASGEEPPSLQKAVAEGKLPPVSERLPKNPLVVDFAAEGKELGRYGGRLTTLLGKAKDIRMMTVNEYARLVGFNTRFELVPDILEDLTSEGDRVFTMKLREGHRWSDGHPFTAEDFRYWWEEVATNEALNEGSVDPAMVPAEKLPVFTVIDETTVRYEWSTPNPLFPLALAGPSPLYIYMPAHYMKQFHPKYADKDELAERVAKENVSDWTALHTRMGRMYRQENPDLPVLDAWHNMTKDATQRAVFERNPYFHRVDPQGRQLPYIDELIVDLGSVDVIAAKAGAGDCDLQARYVRFDNYTFLKQAEKTHDFDVRLWKNGVSSQIALYPNLNVKDPAWNGLLREVQFRRALSIGIDRNEINEQLYFGLATPSGNSVLPASPLYNEKVANAWTEYDPERANRYLDNLGLSRRDDDGVRLMRGGQRMEIVVETAGESTEETDALELIRYHWEDLGIKLFPRTLQRDLLRRRFLNGETVMSVGPGLSIGLVTADMNPEELAPVSAAQPNWPVWGQYTETRGNAGALPPPGPAAELLGLYNRWRQSSSTDERRLIWEGMLSVYADQVFSIGLVSQTIQPVVVNRKLRNVPEKGIYAWSPTAYFGVYRPDTFFYDADDV